MKAAFLGMGTMGRGMAANIIKAGHELTVWNRTAERCLPLKDMGAKVADNPAQASRGAEVVVLCVSDTPDVEQVLLGEGGVVQGAAPGTVVVDCSTISPQATMEFAKALADKGLSLLDAPVSGGSEGAEKGTLTIMVGGDEKALQKAMPIFEAMGNTITHLGPSGTGQYTKSVNQIICGGLYQVVAEGIAFGLKAGLDIEAVVKAVSGGAAANWVLDNRAGNMIKNEYPLGFRLSLHNKDLAITLDAARKLGVNLPVTGMIAQFENGLMARGFGEEDLSALARTMREQAGLD